MKHMEKRFITDLTDYNNARNYIITVTRNYCSNYLHRENRHPEDFPDEIPKPQIDLDEILDTLIIKEQINQLAKEIHKLDDIYKSVLELKIYRWIFE